MIKNDKAEQVLIKALELLNQGKSREEILNLSPENRQEVEEIFRTAELLMLAKNSIAPPKKLLADTLAKLPTAATAREMPSLPKFRLARWLVLVPVGGLALLLVLALVATQGGTRTLQTLDTAAPPESAEIATAPTPDIFNLSALDAEAALAGFDADLYEFLSEESSLQEVDAMLTNL